MPELREMQDGSPSDAELELMEKFIQLQHAGDEPEVETFLAGCPEHADSLRPVLEGAKWFHHEYHELRKVLSETELTSALGLSG